MTKPIYKSWAEHRIYPKPHPTLGTTPRMVSARLYREAICELALCGLTNAHISLYVPFDPAAVSCILSAWRKSGVRIPSNQERRERYYASP